MTGAWCDGEWLPGDRASTWAHETGLLTGDGVFETLRAEGGELLDPEAHRERLAAGLEALDLGSAGSAVELMEVAAELARRLSAPVARIRVTVARRGADRGPLRLVHGGPYRSSGEGAGDRGVSVVSLASPRLDPADPLAGIKSLSWGRQAWAARQARARGAFEGLLLNVHGRVAEASRCNVIVRLGGRLVTPPTSEGCLPGTVRRRLLEAGLVQEETLPATRLDEVTELLLTNSLLRVLAATTLDGRTLQAGQTARCLREASLP